MASFAKITIVGYLGRDPELKHTPQGNAVCKFSVATTERRKDQQGEWQDHTSWFRITCWGRTAELANEYLSKGKQVYVEGRLRVEEYFDREGHAKHSLEINAQDIQFLGSKSDGEPRESARAVPHDEPPQSEKKAAIQKALGAQAPRKGASKQARLPETGDGKKRVQIEDDDLPF